MTIANTNLVCCTFCNQWYDYKVSHEHSCEGKVQAMKDMFKPKRSELVAEIKSMLVDPIREDMEVHDYIFAIKLYDQLLKKVLEVLCQK